MELTCCEITVTNLSCNEITGNPLEHRIPATHPTPNHRIVNNNFPESNSKQLQLGQPDVFKGSLLNQYNFRCFLINRLFSKLVQLSFVMPKYIKLCGVACHASHVIEVSRLARHRGATPNTCDLLSFFFMYFSISLLSAAQHLAPADVCNSSCFFLLYELCFAILQLCASLVQRPANVPLLLHPRFYNNQNHAYFTDEVSTGTIRFFAARLSPLKRVLCAYSPHAWRCNLTPKILACLAFWQSWRGLICFILPVLTSRLCRRRPAGALYQ